MSKASKSRSREQRRKMKIARKAAAKAQWEALIKAGRNQKSTTAETKRTQVNTIDHPLGPCGNIGCRKCSANSTPLIGHRAWLAQQEEKAHEQEKWKAQGRRRRRFVQVDATVQA